MKNNTPMRLAAVLLFCASVVACKKSIDTNVAPDPGISDSSTVALSSDTAQTLVAYPKQRNTNCANAPDYGDSVIFIQSGSFTVKPINHPDTGTYFSWPTGMVIDKNTGAINVSKSETGLRYNIGWVKKGTTDTCMQTMILAGMSYEDSLYVLNDDQRYAKPYYNADPNQAPPCSGSGVPGGGGCSFDLNGQLTKHYIAIDKNTGIIDLKNTASKAFGILPQNGATVQTTMEYKINDASNLAMQKITVKLIYYNRKSDVPADLLAAVTDKLNKIVNQLLLINIPGTGGQQTFSGNPRPPIIIVTRYN